MELNTVESSEFISLAANVEASLLSALRKRLPSMSAIKVLRFVRGSIIAVYQIIFTDPTAVNINIVHIQAVVKTVITSGSLSDALGIDTSYVPSVRG